ncbi:MAG: SufE family protein [Chloroflexales bacterium]|nr:SufE family protein [Chloroflexales bacterium]
MDETTTALPPRLSEIVEEFTDSEGREKLELLLEYSGRMPALPDWLKGDHQRMDQVQECMSPVFVHGERQGDTMQYFFDVPEEAPTVRGFAAVLADGLNGLTPEQVLRVPDYFYTEMGLQGVLTGRRLNGMGAILAYMKRLALREMPS